MNHATIRAPSSRRGPNPRHYGSRAPLTAEERRFWPEALYILKRHRGQRPKVLSDCESGGKNEQRPCPWVSCAHHLKLTVGKDGSLIDGFPNIPLENMLATCVFDVTTTGERTFTEIGEIMNFTEERARQLYHQAIHRSGLAEKIRPFLDEEDLAGRTPMPKRVGLL